MYDELLPMSLSTGATRLGVEPLEVIRLMVQSDTITPSLTLTRGHLGQLATLGGIESGWWDNITLPTDSNAQRAIVRAALGLLADRAENPVRMDNLWRGRPLDQQELIEEALNLLDEAGTLRIVNAPAGVQLVVDPGAIATVRAIAEGSQSVEGLDELLKG